LAPPSIDFHGKAAGLLCDNKLRTAKPQWNTLDIGACALREQQSRLERGFHVGVIYGWYQNRLHHQLLRSLQMNGSAMQANGTDLRQAKPSKRDRQDIRPIASVDVACDPDKAIE
jgi:hypothetical protein